MDEKKKYVVELSDWEKSLLTSALLEAQLKQSMRIRRIKKNIELRKALELGHKTYNELFNKFHFLKVVEWVFLIGGL